MKSPFIIGLVITIASFVMTWTYIVPIISIIPAVMIEGIIEKVIGHEPYRNVGMGVIWFLIIAFVGISISYYRSEVKRIKVNLPFRRDLFLGFLSIQFLIVHPLAFYINWGANLNFRGDGQLIFGIVDTFPMSSFAFVVFGSTIEILRSKPTTPNIKQVEQHAANTQS